MDKIYELGRSSGSRTTIKVKDHAYDTVEFTVSKYLADEVGKPIIDSGYTVFFSKREFHEFMKPMIDDLKVRFDDEDARRNAGN
jgi:CRISPR/Cas system CSM-associated protein Csm2 small subunit